MLGMAPQEWTLGSPAIADLGIMIIWMMMYSSDPHDDAVRGHRCLSNQKFNGARLGRSAIAAHGRNYPYVFFFGFISINYRRLVTERFSMCWPLFIGMMKKGSRDAKFNLFFATYLL